jgi:hypothetical protein
MRLKDAKQASHRVANHQQAFNTGQGNTMKILLWIIGIIFLIGLLVVSGILDLIF